MTPKHMNFVLPCYLEPEVSDRPIVEKKRGMI